MEKVGKFQARSPGLSGEKDAIISPWKIDSLNLKMMVWKMIFLFQGCMLRFHVNLPGCIYIEAAFVVTQKSFCGCRSFLDGNILLMEEILHLLIGSLSHYFKGFLTSQVVGAEFLLSTITERCLKRCYSTMCVHEFRLLPKLALIPLGSDNCCSKFLHISTKHLQPN